ncbi:hypothetical protein FE236_00485 [Mariprofundus erugo]|uniref:5-methylcytosine restriction system specificity protein McrC n=1 Tax=Mariprofundus erugo TaxID=2528639 RepID=UPI0010FEFC03|nr:hypothetical protein [Mariprofundus erugo]TLS78271.1 hypothetical protein FE236_00485 [Mariprofundus erugo]
MKVIARDCSPLQPQPNAEQVAWLQRLAKSVCVNDLVIPFGDTKISDHREDDPIVYCERDGTWWAGRYVGSLSYEGNQLIIEPRFGIATLRNWLFEASSVVVTESPGQLRQDESFIVQLLASVWAHGFVEAARHGLPALRRDVSTKSSTVRGRLDVAASIRHLALGTGEVVSVRSEKSLIHSATDAIVAAYTVLRRWLPDEKWLPQRAKELLPQLIAVTGNRPRVPTKAELDRIRYTPITAGFAPVAELSRQIANRRGLSTDLDSNGETKGVLLDVAELWEMYVLSVLRKAATPLMVKHGTRERSTSRKLLRSEVSAQEMGLLIPDAILFKHGDVVQGVVDAKYKSVHPSLNAPYGPQREDLYQIAAYLGRYATGSNASAFGILAYPSEPERNAASYAEANNPWGLTDGKRVYFITLPHQPDQAVAKVRNLISGSD